MKTRILMLFAACLTILSAIAQNWVGFAYDEAGNRVRREITISQGSRSMDKSEDNEESYYDVLGDRTVKVTQNGSGIFKVAILNMESDDECYIDVCSLGGVQVFMETHCGAETLIDLRDRSNGVYILRVVINEKQTIWKITKL